MQPLIEIIVAVVVLVGVGGGFLLRRSSRRPPQDHAPRRRETTETAEVVDSTIAEPPLTAGPVAEAVETETPEPAAGRLFRLRARLARSESTFGKGLLALLSRDTLDDETWQEVEDLLLTADVGLASTNELVSSLKTKAKVLGSRSAADARTLLRAGLLDLVDPDLDRAVVTQRSLRWWPGGTAGSRRQRHRKNHDLRQNRAVACRGRAHGRAWRRRHISGRSR